MTIAEEIRDGLDFLVSMVKTNDAEIAIAAENNALYACINGVIWSPGQKKKIQARMRQLNWHTDICDILTLQFMHSILPFFNSEKVNVDNNSNRQ